MWCVCSCCDNAQERERSYTSAEYQAAQEVTEATRLLQTMRPYPGEADTIFAFRRWRAASNVAMKKEHLQEVTKKYGLQ